MINHIISFSIKNKLIVGLFTLALIVGGLWSMTKIPLDAVPDITNNQVQVITQAPNLGTIDIEQFISYPIELAMANLPGVIEIRSVSRFGLSVVTIVFEDHLGTFLPRQLVSEKLSEVKEEIPQGFGEPTMGPISTGLGEIFQYTLKVDSAYKAIYSSTDLRTIQDWIIRRQMTMVPGVVEINAIGGEIKQYEVAISPDELKAIGITLTDIFNALEANNQNTGGAYIEKNHQANFIRGEGLIRNLGDIESIMIKNVNGIPITIKDVAKVQFGSAIRYGALTQDGEGEVVGGLVMMLKGANSNDVVKRVKERISKIQESLPKGITIEPFLDRTKLIAKTTQTVSTNLIEGALIVIFVLIFLLGNWRGGIIVATTIPLSLLFAFILMNVFDVWANLMSLGAIDFGIIVDGAVIIVESTVFLLYQNLTKQKLVTSEERDKIAYTASTKMMNAAFFGQLIILIVFVPILTLQGIEGKMFTPMALTFMFAMIGVIILCLTYVPMMSSWFIKIPTKKQETWGDRLISTLEKFYEPLLAKALKQYRWIIPTTALLLGLACFIFSKLGGEFVPQLDEGDIAFHAILKPGSSLTEMTHTTTQIEKMMREKFPEVEKIVSRIGVAEVPTDPMPMDLADVIVILAPKDKWVTTQDKEELVEMMKTALQKIPGVNYEFTQPIEMRFNELLEGVREDIAIKLYGEDIGILAEKAEQISHIIAGTKGIGDMRVEATQGLPQITVRYERHKLAQYGLHIQDLNKLLQSAFAGGKAGVIFEGEKRFDLVVRLDKKHRNSIEDLRNLYINLPHGAQVPIKEVAHISYQPGPIQISRDNTHRRTYVGINVRGRDIESLVTEIKQKLDQQLELPPGYYIRYGGAFENLKRAGKRLQVVVPLALGIIFLLIFFALKSLQQTAMIYAAIPLAAIGGVFSLWIRDMPFSISAGVGFIVLFGVSALNGLVLISSWNELKEDGMTNLQDRILFGAKRRIRPVLLTALTDILGFLPMAISSSAGAEVQRPLATVVIGGMISATLLTLFVLPILYQWIASQKKTTVLIRTPLILLLTGGILLTFNNQAAAQNTQPATITHVEEALAIGLSNNGNIQTAKTEIEIQIENQKGSFNPGKTFAGVQYGQYNSFKNDMAFTLTQNFEFPTVYRNQRKLAQEHKEEHRIKLSLSENNLKRNIRASWYELAYLKEKEKLLLFQDSLYSLILHAATIRYETEAASYLELTTSKTKAMEIQNHLRVNMADIAIAEKQLQILLQDTVGLQFSPKTLKEIPLPVNVDSALLLNNPLLQYSRQQVDIAQAEKALHTSKILPGFSIGYINQSLIGSPLESGSPASRSDRFNSITASISVPLFYRSFKTRIRSSQLKEVVAHNNTIYQEHILKGQYEQQWEELLKLKNSLEYYKTQGLPQADLIFRTATLSFENEAISYIEYSHHISQGLALKFNYLSTLQEYNQAVINLEHLLGK